MPEAAAVERPRRELHCEGRASAARSLLTVALVTDAWLPQINGVVTTLSKLRGELESMGHEMLVINPSQFITVPCPKYREIRLSCLPGRAVARMLLDYAPDAIHIATEGPLGMAARRYCMRNRVPFTTSYHTQFAQYVRRYAGVPEQYTFKVLRRFHNAAVATLVPTASIKRELDSRGFRNIRVWARGVDVDLFQPYGKSFLDGARPIFLYAGRVAREKNIEAFLAADLPGTKYVVGDGPAAAELRQRYPAARFVGYKHGEDLARHYAAADVFVFPSRTDTFGIILIEALACGVPVAAYPVPGSIDNIDDGVTGAIDHDLRAAALRALNMNPDACRQAALKHTWRRCAEIFLDTLAIIPNSSRGL